MADREQTDGELLAAYRTGEKSALGLLITRYERPLYTFILRMTGPSDADDVYQETWIRAIRALQGFDDRKPLSWLFRIARNLVIDRSRRSSRMVPLETEGGQDRLACSRPDPSSQAEDSDLGRRIRRAVEELPAEQREVFLMRTEADLPFKDIARIQRVSINTALARMQYALDKLRTALKDDFKKEGQP